MANKAAPKWVSKPCPCCGKYRKVVNGSWLRQRRIASRISLRSFATAHGLSAAFISDVELGQRNCTAGLKEAYEALS